MKTPDDVSAMAAFEGAWLGVKADCGGARLFEEHREALAAVWRLATLRDAVALEEAGRLVGLAGGAVSAARAAMPT